MSNSNDIKSRLSSNRCSHELVNKEYCRKCGVLFYKKVFHHYI